MKSTNKIILSKIEYAGIILGCISTLFGVILKFKEFNIDSSVMNYWLFLLKYLHIEFILFGVFVLLLTFYKRLKLHIKSKILKYSSETRYVIISIIVISVILFFVFSNIYGVVRSRYVYYNGSIYKAYKNELYHKGRVYESNIDFENAIDIYKTILEKFPKQGGNRAIEERLNVLQNRKKLSEVYYKLANVKNATHHFNKDSWYYLIMSYFSYPSEKQVLNEIIPRKLEIEKAISNYGDFYQSVIENNKSVIDSLYDKYGWVYFDENVKNLFVEEEYNKRLIYYTKLKEIVSYHSQEDMIKIMQSAWRINELEDILSDNQK